MIGVLLSIVGSIISEICFSLVLPVIIGFKDPMRFDFVSLAVWGPVTIVLATAATLFPAWRNSRLRIVETLQYE